MKTGEALMSMASVAAFLIGICPHLPGSAPSAVQATPCTATPLQSAPFRFAKPGLKDVPWIKATPLSSGITGHLFFAGARGARFFRVGASERAAALHINGKMPDGATTKILWLIGNPHVGGELTITGRNLTRAGTMHQVFSGADEVPSIVDIPTSGCWRLILRSGTVQGTVTMIAVK